MIPSRSVRKRFLACAFLLAGLWLALGARIAMLGDTQGNASVHAEVAALIAAQNPQIAFHLGDLTSKGSKQSHYDAFFQTAAPLTAVCPLYPARGNHDRSLELWLANFPSVGGSSYYAVEHDSLLFLVLDSNLDLTPGSEQDAWLRQQLDSGPSLPRLVILHRPIFSGGYHGGDEDLQLLLPALFADSGVVAVFSGHDHNYERSEYRGVSYFVSGGAGGLIRPGFSCNPYSKVFANTRNYLILDRQGRSLNCTAYDLDGQVLDSVLLTLP